MSIDNVWPKIGTAAAIEKFVFLTCYQSD